VIEEANELVKAPNRIDGTEYDERERAVLSTHSSDKGTDKRCVIWVIVCNINTFGGKYIPTKPHQPPRACVNKNRIPSTEIEEETCPAPTKAWNEGRAA
jgi:hypothetical protein